MIYQIYNTIFMIIENFGIGDMNPMTYALNEEAIKKQRQFSKTIVQPIQTKYREFYAKKEGITFIDATIKDDQFNQVLDETCSILSAFLSDIKIDSEKIIDSVREKININRDYMKSIGGNIGILGVHETFLKDINAKSLDYLTPHEKKLFPLFGDFIKWALSKNATISSDDILTYSIKSRSIVPKFNPLPTDISLPEQLNIFKKIIRKNKMKYLTANVKLINEKCLIPDKEFLIDPTLEYWGTIVGYMIDGRVICKIENEYVVVTPLHIVKLNS